MTTVKNSPAKATKTATNSKVAPKAKKPVTRKPAQSQPATQAKAAPKKAIAKAIGGPRIRVDMDAAKKAQYRGARAAWLERLVEWDGQPLVTFKEQVQLDPPSTPKTGKWAGKCEPPMGWVKFFMREQIVKLAD